MNQWQPMINRCTAMGDRVEELLTRRASIPNCRDRSLVIYTTDDLETMLYAARYVANSLGAMKMGASQQGTCAPVLSEYNKFNPQTELKESYGEIPDWGEGNKENPADWENEK